MEKSIISLLLGSVLLLIVTKVAAQPAKNCEQGIALNTNYSKAAAFDSILQHYTKSGLPGASMAVYTEKEGWWAGAAGWANIEKKIPMENCHLQYLQSVSKSFMAVEIMLLKEQGKIDIDAPITKYLPAKFSRYVAGAEKVTVRMLLNHVSGIPEYNENPGFVSQVIQHPLDNFSAEDCLRSIAGKELEWKPGSKYRYVNTNYLLLALIGDAITGDHAAYIRDHIFRPLGMSNSFYDNGHAYLKGRHLPESYWDVFNNGVAVNVTGFQQSTVVSSKGDDGIVCTTVDAIKFLKGLMEGKLVKPGTLKEMLEFVKDEKGNKRYGMGISYFDIAGLEAYGHGGGGVGAGCGLTYIPSHKAYVFIATNLNVLIDTKLGQNAVGFRDAVLGTLLQ